MTSNLIAIINIAKDSKPSVGKPCNSCGWCCLTEVCDIGREMTGSSMIPCSLLVSDGGNHICSLARAEVAMDDLGIGTGCCAETQDEVIARLTG